MDDFDDKQSRRSEQHNYRTVQSEGSYSDTIAVHFKAHFDLPSSDNVIEAIISFGKIISRDETEINDVIKPFRKKSSDHHPSLCIHAYTRETFLVYTMNDCIRGDHKEQLKTIYPYINTLMNGLKSYPFHGTVYRGFVLNTEQVAKYKKDRTFFWPGFSSSSKNFSVAAHFAQCNVVFEIIIPQPFSHCCGDISQKSAYPGEEEVLLKPYTYFRVLDQKTRKESGKTYTVPVLLVEATALNLSGVWQSNDGGDYFVCQYGRKVFWYGRSGQKTRYSWSHVAYGTIDDNEVIHLTFGDIPIGKDRYTGSIDIQISNDYALMTKISDPKNTFLTKSWKRVSSQYYEEFMSTALPTSWSNDSDQVTGLWKCNDGGNYYISQFHKHIFWLGCHPKGYWCHVAIGKLDKKSGIIDLDWGDIICGANRLHGTLRVLVENNNTITKLNEQLMGLDQSIFSGSEWHKTKPK